LWVCLVLPQFSRDARRNDNQVLPGYCLNPSLSFFSSANLPILNSASTSTLCTKKGALRPFPDF
jgi:hypothetical protein